MTRERSSAVGCSNHAPNKEGTETSQDAGFSLFRIVPITRPTKRALKLNNTLPIYEDHRSVPITRPTKRALKRRKQRDPSRITYSVPITRPTKRALKPLVHFLHKRSHLEVPITRPTKRALKRSGVRAASLRTRCSNHAPNKEGTETGSGIEDRGSGIGSNHAPNKEGTETRSSPIRSRRPQVPITRPTKRALKPKFSMTESPVASSFQSRAQQRGH